MKILTKQTATILCVVMIVASCISGTLAYLTSEANDTNTFVIGKIKIDISETDTKVDEDQNDKTNTYKIVTSGQFLTKDPIVTVNSGSAPCWLFVELIESENFDEFLEYEVEEGWEKLDGEDNIYYRKIDSRTLIDTQYPVLKNNSVKVKDDVTVESLNLLTEDTYPSLSVKAYAMQLGEETTVLGNAKDAWEQLNEQKK